MSTLDRDAAREVLQINYGPSMLRESLLDALEGCVRPAPAIDRADLRQVIRKELEKQEGTRDPYHAVYADAIAGAILALLRPVDGVVLSNEEANRVWDWAMRLDDETDGLTPEDSALADRLRVVS